jgi:hypothetical protein
MGMESVPWMICFGSSATSQLTLLSKLKLSVMAEKYSGSLFASQLRNLQGYRGINSIGR